MTSFFRKFRWHVQRRKKEDDLAAELQFHMEEEAEELQAGGAAQADARFAARRGLGNLGLIREETRAAWSWTLVEQTLQDLRYAVRMILRSPAFTVLAVSSLALGIGANTAIYSFMDALLMRSLPVADPGSLVVLKWRLDGAKHGSDSVIHDISGQIDDDSESGKVASIFPFPAFEELRRTGSVFSSLFAYRRAPKLNVLIGLQAEVTSGEYVSGDYFQGLALVPSAGRLIAVDDDRAGAPPAVVVSYAFAGRRFGNGAQAVGAPVTINNASFTIIGVAPAEFRGVDPGRTPDLFLPLHAGALVNPEDGPDSRLDRFVDEHYYWTEMMGRLRPGVTISLAQSVLEPVFRRWVEATAQTEGERRSLPRLALADGATGLDNLRRKYSKPLYVLLAMVGLLLALACANIANLLLSRAEARRREIAVRLSIGAGRGRIVRQLLAESLLLAGLGGILGILFAVWGIHFLTLLLGGTGGSFPLRAELNMNVLLATSVLTVVTGLLFGLAPARQATRVDPMPVLKENQSGGPRGGRSRRFPLSRVLVVAQMGISLLLLVAAGLFVRTLSNLHSVETGFVRDNLLLFKLNARQAGHRDPEILPFYRDLESRFAAIPGVRAATMANSPLIGDGAWGWPVVPVGKEPPAHAPSGHGSGMTASATRTLAAGPGFFKTMGIPLLDGREFDERDRQGSTPVAIVNQAWANLNLDGGSPIGQHVISYGPAKYELEIVGVVQNARYDDLTGPFPSVVYLALDQDLASQVAEMTFFLRTAAAPLTYAKPVRDIVQQTDSRIPVTNLSTQTAQIEGEFTPQILFAKLCTAFALLALAISFVGMYGTTSYAVARRTGEIGIRMALGASRRTVVWMVLRDVLILAAVGFAISLPAAMAGSKVVESLLYGVAPTDPTAIAAAAAILTAAALIAGFLPARRASRIDPMVAVRHD